MTGVQTCALPICIKAGAKLLESFMPETSDKILAQLGDGKVTEKPEILFARLDVNEVMKKVEELHPHVEEKETEAEVYSAVWDLMIELEKNLPMAYVFYGQDSLVENNNRYDEIGIFLPNSSFLKNLERHVAKAEEIIYGEK